MTLIGSDHLHDAASLWDDVLRAYAESLDEQRAYLLSAQPDELADSRTWMPPTFALPASMPPMPDEFASWAQALLRDTEGLAQLAADVLDSIPAPTMRAPRRLPTTGEITNGQSTWDRSM
ncbi:MAG: hypothetical protein JWN99_1612 [Ilumatobacteraceae bacterium]|nr:hypothetical protein [Ilumatobacteraceae bacterium]